MRVLDFIFLKNKNFFKRLNYYYYYDYDYYYYKIDYKIIIGNAGCVIFLLFTDCWS